ncbi:hypothetical protein B0A81_08315 [Flavobacterium plurextorum]|uniref:Uncharacterized protein n=1 Tax=Flavobacterium plurextorum TaxID=1114867 RepID=A0ABX4CWF4_9FLAO|nr:hypothetical protein B0A81_08315 [Flavobacterium plurextorum]
MQDCLHYDVGIITIEGIYLFLIMKQAARRLGSYLVENWSFSFWKCSFFVRLVCWFLLYIFDKEGMMLAVVTLFVLRADILMQKRGVF